ncbi:MAG: hypothetical protein ACTSWR_10485 [Candidatus Helarchaeota archaeon]
MDKNKPYLYDNKIELIQDLNKDISNFSEITNSTDLNRNLPYILIDIPKIRKFKDIEFVIADPDYPESEEVRSLKYVGRILRNLDPKFEIIPTIAYVFVQNKDNMHLIEKIKEEVIAFFRDRFNIPNFRKN